MRLPGLRTIVTGGASGMGLAYATRLVEAGASVVVGDVDERGFASLPAGVHAMRVDVRDEADVERFVAFADERLGGLDALVNNAGILREGSLVKRDRTTGAITRFPRADFDRVLEVNLLGTMLVTRAFAARKLVLGGPGVIVNVSSIARHGSRGRTAYVAAKAGVSALTTTWAKELGPSGLRVCAIAPGAVRTPMTAGMTEAQERALVAKIPVGRLATPDDLFLALRFALECDYFHGRTIDVDGGMAID